MKKRIVILFAGAALAAGVAAFALDALKPGDESPAQVVLARKAAMQSNFANFGDIRAKAAAGELKSIAVNARSMAVIGTFLPLAFADTYIDSYPEGYKYFYKGGSVEDIQAMAQDFISVVESLASFAEAEDKDGVDAQIAAILPACGACHVPYRGQN